MLDFHNNLLGEFPADYYRRCFWTLICDKHITFICLLLW